MAPDPGLPALTYANADYVTPSLLVGGDLDYFDTDLAAKQLDELVSVGLTHVVDVRQEWSDEELFADAAPQVHYLHHGVDDAGQRIPSEWFEVGVSYVLDALTAPGTTVLVHCHMGINRGPSLGYAVLLGLGWEPMEAITAIRTARPIAFVDYAGDALVWHHQRRGSGKKALRRDLQRLAEWRETYELDAAEVIRGIRASGRG